ncbi:hypothetical protein QQP08_017357, partial [Theobroma cacao]
AYFQSTLISMVSLLSLSAIARLIQNFRSPDPTMSMSMMFVRNRKISTGLKQVIERS